MAGEETNGRQGIRLHRRAVSLLNSISTLAAATAAVILLETLLLPVIQIFGSSMTPALYEEDFVIAVMYVKPRRGDIVAFYSNGKILVKRVIALPGQTFSMEDGRVYLDGELLDEPYITEFSRDRYPETVVPENCYLVLGDHRTNSNDARYWADPFVRREDLLARGLFVYFPEFHTF